MRDGDRRDRSARACAWCGLSGLSSSAAAALLAERAADLAPDLRDRLIEEASGNPLALIELAAARARAIRRRGPPTVGGRAVHGRAPGAGRVRFAGGPPAAIRTRMALLVAAAEDTGELGVVLNAVGRIGLGLNDFEPAERARLVRVVDGCCQLPASADPFGGVRTRTRSGSHHRPSGARRCAAGPSTPTGEHGISPAAAGGFDDDAADAMEAAALRADRRGGYAASAAAHERAARLTADPLVRGGRLAAAAMGARDSAQLDRAAALAQEASALTEDPRTLAKLAWVRARLEFERGTPRHASEMVLAGAETVYDCDARRGRQDADRGGPDGVLCRRGAGPRARRRTDRRGAAAGRPSAAPDAGGQLDTREAASPVDAAGSGSAASTRCRVRSGPNGWE